MYDVVVVLRHAPGHVGPPSEHDHVVHGHLCVGHVLCHEGYAFCDLPVGEREQILTVDTAVPAVSREDTVHALEQRALADAVVAEHGQKVPGLQFKAHIAEDRLPALIVIAEMVHTDHVRPLPLNSRYKTAGRRETPVSAPIGRNDRHDDHARGQITQQQQRRAGEHGAGDEIDIVVADDHAHDVRRNETDEVDEADVRHDHRADKAREHNVRECQPPAPWMPRLSAVSSPESRAL